ncbi:MAG TPA: acyltransferase [Chthoniobacterales bacterium]|nr:acyltransferase [Chthoniobacterales bacterium]
MDKLIQYSTGFWSRIRKRFLLARGAVIPGAVRLGKIEVPRNAWAFQLENGVALDNGVVLLFTDASQAGRGPYVIIRENVYVNRYTVIDASTHLEIGRDTMIGPHCYITDHDHGFSIGERPGHTDLVISPTKIGERCWLGAGVIVLKGVEIGSGTVVAAGAVVTRSLPEGVVAAGVPARIIKSIEEDKPARVTIIPNRHRAVIPSKL